MAQFTAKRLENYPDIPTVKELGYGDVHSSSWFGLHAPKGTPAAIAERLKAVVKQVADDPGFAKILKESGENPSYADAQAIKKQYQEEYETLYPMMMNK